ncbi:luciferase [Cellulomonas cellasea DSM 20118]|uniref:Luciferase n=2 Tax=Cellulomonas cellasea TaxID=43670 RepID=A0A0A0B421_9CELL|nr:luciferase [Cellulomonas cellasea DSM 20118]GEA86822.1 monooxygenase [Cellulomonas cellasea]
MRFGFVGSFGSVAQTVALAQEAEAHGWDGFFTWDGISVGELDTWDPWTLLGALAVSTERIRLGAMIFPLARRRPWKVARETVTVDHLSGGRLVLPVGLGAVDDGGFAGVSGETTSARGRAERLDDALAILERAWSGERFSYAGTHHTVTDLVFRPQPVQRPRIPVWAVGAWPSERSMGRAARWDGVIPQGRTGPVTPDDVRALVAWTDERRRALAAAEPERFLGDFDVVVEGVLPEGPDAAAAHARAYADAGATWWVESRWDAQRDTPETLLDRVRQGPPRL